MEPVDQNTLVKRVLTNEYMISGWRITDAPDVSSTVYLNNYSTSSSNLAHFKSAEMDKLLDEMQVETDRIKRDRMLCRAAEIMNESGHIQFRGGNRYHIFARKWVKGVGPIFRGAINLSTAWVESETGRPAAAALDR